MGPFYGHERKGRHIGTDPGSVSALAILHSPRPADFGCSEKPPGQPTPLELVDKNDMRDDLLPVLSSDHDRRRLFPVYGSEGVVSTLPYFVDLYDRFVWYRCRSGQDSWGSRPYWRTAPVLAYRHTHGCSSVCHFER